MKVLVVNGRVHEILTEEMYQQLLKQQPLNPIMALDANAPPTVQVGQVIQNGQYVVPTPTVVADADMAASTLVRTDHIILNMYEHAIPVPADWTTWRDALRTIAAGGPGPVPPMPALPAGIGPLLKEPLP